MAKSKKNVSKIKFASGKSHQRISYGFLMVSLLSGALLFLILILFQDTDYVYESPTREDIYSLRELMIASVENTNIDAPVSTDDGQVYLPEASVFIAGSNGFDRIAYHSDRDEFGNLVLYLTDKEEVQKQINQLYISQNSETLYDRLAKAQACSAGIMITFDEAKNNDGDDYDYEKAVQLGDERMAYIHTHNDCRQELNDTNELLNGIRSNQ